MVGSLGKDYRGSLSYAQEKMTGALGVGFRVYGQYVRLQTPKTLATQHKDLCIAVGLIEPTKVIDEYLFIQPRVQWRAQGM